MSVCQVSLQYPPCARAAWLRPNLCFKLDLLLYSGAWLSVLPLQSLHQFRYPGRTNNIHIYIYICIYIYIYIYIYISTSGPTWLGTTHRPGRPWKTLVSRLVFSSCVGSSIWRWNPTKVCERFRLGLCLCISPFRPSLLSFSFLFSLAPMCWSVRSPYSTLLGPGLPGWTRCGYIYIYIYIYIYTYIYIYMYVICSSWITKLMQGLKREDRQPSPRVQQKIQLKTEIGPKPGSPGTRRVL